MSLNIKYKVRQKVKTAYEEVPERCSGSVVGWVPCVQKVAGSNPTLDST